MTTPALENQTLLQVPFYKLEVVNGEVRIVKNKAILNRYFKLVSALVALFVVLFWLLPTKMSSDSSDKATDISKILIFCAVGVFTAITIFLSTRRLARVISNYTLKRDKGLYINDKAVSLSFDLEEPTVVIQDVAASGGVGGSYTVGIATGKKFFGLCYELNEVDASKIASFMSNHLSVKLERREATAFPLFKLH